MSAAVLFQFLLIADGQLMAAFCATAGQHFSAIGSLHPFTETVNCLTAAAMGLKCTFHFKSVFSLLRNGPGRTGFVSVLPTGHHTRWFCERTAKVGVGGQNLTAREGIFFGEAVKISWLADWLTG
jgi:hypothetical protein